MTEGAPRRVGLVTELAGGVGVDALSLAGGGRSSVPAATVARSAERTVAACRCFTRSGALARQP